MNCKHWKECGLKSGGCCDLHGSVSFGVCSVCPDLTDLKWLDKYKRKHKLGDKAEALIGKIPGVKKLPCYDKNGKLRPESPCGKRKKDWNGE
jgi:hypothetical protein